jgi:hypothetical protein
MKKLAFFAFVYFLTINLSFGQTHKTIEKKRTLPVENTDKVQATVKVQTESSYFNYENKILEISINNSIPSTFPTSNGFNSKESYRTAMNKWIKENPALIKPEFKNTIIKD